MKITEEVLHGIRDNIESAITDAFRQGPDPATKRNIANTYAAKIAESLETGHE